MNKTASNGFNVGQHVFRILTDRRYWWIRPMALKFAAVHAQALRRQRRQPGHR